ncbi:Glycosyltransferase [Hexamita inflata]|uniref:protein xylosyltransferase n=1 Tax=Hexamita inflata TaxID=28002 RepID=A0AA86PQU6_9EUKA|nr:Glycosyltransferase [Hexamita inflata]
MYLYLLSMQKHAFLIMAHNQPTLLQTLVSQIDNEETDIYIHIDAKSNMSLPKAKYSKLFFTNRVSVLWGTSKQIEAELILFQAAYKRNYDFYHFISGSDLLIQPIYTILAFFSAHINKQFIGFSNDLEWFKYIGQNSIDRLPALQNKYNILRHGANWCSLTQQAVNILLKNKQNILSDFGGMHTADEIYKQTVLFQHRNMLQFYDSENEQNGHQRYIDWSQGGSHPKDLNYNDIKKIQESGLMFARKFSEKNLNAIKIMYNYTNRKQVQ